MLSMAISCVSQAMAGKHAPIVLALHACLNTCQCDDSRHGPGQVTTILRLHSAVVLSNVSIGSFHQAQGGWRVFKQCVFQHMSCNQGQRLRLRAQHVRRVKIGMGV